MKHAKWKNQKGKQFLQNIQVHIIYKFVQTEYKALLRYFKIHMNISNLQLFYVHTGYITVLIRGIMHNFHWEKLENIPYINQIT